MAKITVYGFLVPDIREDCYVGARGKATREKIKSLGGKVVEETAEEIDDLMLNDTGRYHGPPSSQA